MNAPNTATPPLSEWSTRQVSPSDATDAWQAALNTHYGEWQLTRAVNNRFAARIRNRDFSGLRVVECVCDPCSGQRISQHINRDTARYIGVQITKSGHEQFCFGSEAITVGSGDLVIWTSDHPTAFTVTEKLHKVSLILPWSDIQERLPRGAQFNGTVIDSRSGIGAVLFSHVDSLAGQLEVLGDNDHAAVRRATLELLAAAMCHRVEAPPRGLAMRYLRQLQDYILAHLQDENLTPTRIAEANHMSPRYVHMLFAQIDVSVSTWIRIQRLERCREDLCSRTYRDTGIAEIAYAWGFNDATHFSRAFKRQFGINPRECRERAAAK